MAQAQAPRLEMLWESRDPGEVLRDRFGFDRSGDVVAWVSSALAHHWGIQVSSCARITMSDSNALAWVATSSGPMVVKWGIAPARFPRLAALARLTTWLGDEGLPVSAPVPTLGGQVQLELDGASLGLQREIAGALLDAGSPRQVRAAGSALCRLHDALARYPDLERVPAPAPPRSLRARVSTWLETAPEHVPTRSVDALRALLADAPSEPLPVQLVHGDFRAANVLCAEQDVTAVFDFEEARSDHRVVELARSAVMLGTKFHDWAPVSSAVRAQLLEGYESIRPLTAKEAAWWPVLVLWTSLVMVPAGDDPTGWGSAALDQVDELQRAETSETVSGPPRP